jgi:hypothetical protein
VFDDLNQLIGGAGATDPHRQGFPGVLVDDVGKLESPSIGGLIELEVDRPHLIRRASLTFMPPYWFRQRFQVDSAISRWRRTSVRSLPSFNIRSPSRSLRTACSGVCR